MRIRSSSNQANQNVFCQKSSVTFNIVNKTSSESNNQQNESQSIKSENDVPKELTRGECNKWKIKLLCHPIELELKYEKQRRQQKLGLSNQEILNNVYLKVVTEEQQEHKQKRRRLRRDILDIEQNSKHESDGVISVLKNFKPKLMICITVYNETRDQLQLTIDGILKNLPHFKKAGVANHEIIVVVMYDGIEKLNNSSKPDENLFNMFDEFDKFLDIKDFPTNKACNNPFFNKSTKQFNTLRAQYTRYCQQKDNYNVDLTAYQKLAKNKNAIIELNPDQQQIYEELKKESCYNLHDNQLKVKAMEICKQHARQYLKDRATTAYVYQVMQETFENFYNLELNEHKLSFTDLDEEEIFDEKYLYIFHCVKFKNGGKLNSHLWFLRGFCEQFNPQYCILIDCGLEPEPTALLKFFQALEADKQIGGVCGFMGLRKEPLTFQEKINTFQHVGPVSKLFSLAFDIQQAQIYEYNLAHFIDKASESIFGFIHVLPGAFSGYRWEVMRRKDGKSILDEYLKSQLIHEYQYKSIQEANMFLAEDRVMCLKICTQGYKLAYIPEAFALVDPPKNLQTLQGQRRRWINGSWFALNYVVDHSWQVQQTSHTWLQKNVMFFLSINIAQLMQLQAYLSLGTNFILIYIAQTLYIRKVIVVFILGPNSPYTELFGTILCQIILFGYWIIVGLLIFNSLKYNNINQIAVPRYYAISTVLGCYMLFTYIIFLVGLFKLFFDPNEACLVEFTDPFILNILLITAITMQLVIMIPNYRHIWTTLKGFIHYTFYHTTYSFIFIIYSFSRIDDLTWGTKGLTTTEDPQMMHIRDQNKRKKYKFLCKWLILNLLYTGIIIVLSELSPVIKGHIFMFFAWMSCSILVMRCILSLIFYNIYHFSFRPKMKQFAKENKKHYLMEGRKIETNLENLLNLYFTKAKQDQQLQQLKLSKSQIFDQLIKSTFMKNKTSNSSKMFQDDSDSSSTPGNSITLKKNSSINLSQLDKSIDNIESTIKSDKEDNDDDIDSDSNQNKFSKSQIIGDLIRQSKKTRFHKKNKNSKLKNL